MYWLKEVLKIFSKNKKDWATLFFGMLFLSLMVYFKSPNMISLQTIIILIILTSINRYNFVSDYILKSDMDKLRKNKNIISYIFSKNLFSFGIIILFVFCELIGIWAIDGSLAKSRYYITIIVLSLCVLAIDNIVFIFLNKPSKLTSKELTSEENIKIGLKDLAESLPSIILVVIIYFINKNFYEINLGIAIIFWGISVIFLRKALKKHME